MITNEDATVPVKTVSNNPVAMEIGMRDPTFDVPILDLSPNNMKEAIGPHHSLSRRLRYHEIRKTLGLVLTGEFIQQDGKRVFQRFDKPRIITVPAQIKSVMNRAPGEVFYVLSNMPIEKHLAQVVPVQLSPSFVSYLKDEEARVNQNGGRKTRKGRRLKWTPEGIRGDED